MNEKNSFKHNLTVVCIKDEKEFYQLKQPWNKLVEKTETKSIFLRHEWYDAAWQWRKLDSHLYIVCIKRNDEFIGICPLLRRTIVRYGVSKNIIEPLSVPDTQYFDIIASPSDLIDVTSEFSQYLITNKSPWDLLIFSKVTTDSNMLRTLPSALKQYGFSYILKEGGVNPGIRLNTDWKSYYKTRSRRLKKGNNHVKNRLERNVTNVEIQNFRCNSISSDLISETINTITLISAQSWKKMTKLTLDNTGPNAFINRLSEHACDNGWLSIWVLFFDKKPVAMEYQIIFNKIAYALRSDYVDKYDDLSPGTYLNWKLLERMFKDEIIYYSMGPGENEYKLRWSDTAISLSHITIYNKTFLNMVEYQLKTNVVPIINKIKMFLTKNDNVL